MYLEVRCYHMHRITYTYMALEWDKQEDWTLKIENDAVCSKLDTIYHCRIISRFLRTRSGW